MSDETNGLYAFPPNYRACGVLLHVTSLPSPYGIGDLGPPARTWVDLLHQAGQTWWQVLPLGPTGRGNSPYEPRSSFARNWLLISPDDLIADGLVRSGDTAGACFPAAAVDYDAVTAFKHGLLQTVWTNWHLGAGRDLKPAFEQFCHDQAHWLDDYALFETLQARYCGACYLEWPADLVRRSPAALARARRDLADEIDRSRLAQFLVSRQADRLKQYAHAAHVRLIGDLPFFVSPDSSDVWANPELFLLDDQHRPLFVAGVPPDYFSAEGQVWGTPAYNWEALRATSYRWWIDRICASLLDVDLIRLDHFRGFAAAWQIPAGAPFAPAGRWVAGPGAEFLLAVQKDLGALPFIAEDLGIITPDVIALRDQFHLPGTRVLQFAFDGGPDNPYLPSNYVPNTVAYTGTHDTNTTRGWFEALPDHQRLVVCHYLNRARVDPLDAAAELLRLAWTSVAVLALAPLQDVCNLGADARMNVPGRAGGNWRWRSTDDLLGPPAFQYLRELTKTSNRLPVRC
jgi:4-alpha-glucanotransferase